MRTFIVLLVIMTTLPLAACRLEPSIDPSKAATASPEAIDSTDLVGKPISASGNSLPSETLSENDSAYPESTAILWADGFLWTANESGLLTRWDVQTQNYIQVRLPDGAVIWALTSDGRTLYAGTDRGDVWQLTDDGPPTRIKESASGWISALALDENHNLWYADIDHTDQEERRYQAGRGLVWLESIQPPDWSQSKEREFNIVDKSYVDGNPLQHISALEFDNERSILWVGTRLEGLLGYDANQETWQHYNTVNTQLENNTIHDVKVAPDGSLWLATASGVSAYRNGEWENHQLIKDALAGGALSLGIADDNTVWVAGESYIAQKTPGKTWQVYHVIDNPLLTDRVRFVALDDEDHPWYIGRRGKTHFDGDNWTAYDADVRRFAVFTPMPPPKKIVPPPLDFPSPAQDHDNWLQSWPRPEADNGWCIHFLQAHQFDAIEAQRQVNRMKRLGMRWTLVHYADHEQLVLIAPIFQEAGITVIWRPFVRPYETYPSWAQDVEYLRSRGLAPYIQLYNEPSLDQEWQDVQAIDQETYVGNLQDAAREVYDAGGYVGLQFVNPDWLRLALQGLKTQGMNDVFDRLFFIPHPYGLNHPPEYDEDINSVLGFREFASVFEEEIGFVPVMIAGEGGWRPGEAQDNRYPAVSEQLHRDYHLAVFDWFQTGQLSDGQALPDYFFAYCPWLISDPHDPAAWFDNNTGDRTSTIRAVEAIPSFERKFSWGR